jgi:hypothetical protein
VPLLPEHIKSFAQKQGPDPAALTALMRFASDLYEVIGPEHTLDALNALARVGGWERELQFLGLHTTKPNASEGGCRNE